MDRTVLVVEDDSEINELLGEYLSLEGILPISALDGAAALAKLIDARPDAAILDLMLPDIDGYEVCRQIASHRLTAAIPVIVLTCMNQDCDREKAIVSGAFRFMNKPFLPDDLIALLHDAFEWKKNLPLRPPAGQIEIASDATLAMYHGLNEMMADVFTHSALPDVYIAQLREAFHTLAQWALDWGTRHGRNPRLLIHYRLNVMPSGELAAGKTADVLEWTLSELEPGLLADTVFKTPTPPTALLKAPPPVLSPDDSPAPLAGWYQFLAKSGVARFEKDSKIGLIKLQRPLRESLDQTPAVPVVTIDGTRMPTRLRTEAIAAKHK